MSMSQARQSCSSEKGGGGGTQQPLFMLLSVTNSHPDPVGYSATQGNLKR